MIDCPDCDRPLHGSPKCGCGWIEPAPMPKKAIGYREPAKPFVPAKPETVANFKEAVKGFGRREGKYWRPEVVRTHGQVSMIVIQADRFGPGSIPARFLRECKDYGCITEDNRLAKPREREMGEDENYTWEAA